MLKTLIGLLLTISFAYSNQGESNSLVKQRKEILDLKKELNIFYMKKEKEYQKRKQEIQKILTQVENEKKEIEELFNKNKQILNDIEGTVDSKISKIYNTTQ